MPNLSDLNIILTRYQNHVGAYDKAKWEQTLEERILSTRNIATKKSDKVGSDLIDLDLVQGSSFPKAKPKHGLFTVTKQAFFRFIFLPFYHDWWSTQTSRDLYIFFVILYSAQVFNVLLYITQPSQNTSLNNQTCDKEVIYGPKNYPGGPGKNDSNNLGTTVLVQTCDILSPIVLMIVLTILHSQIASTNFSSSISTNSSTNNSSTSLNNKNRNGSRKNSGTNSVTKPSRKTRRVRLPPSRRRSSNLSPVSPLNLTIVKHHGPSESDISAEPPTIHHLAAPVGCISSRRSSSGLSPSSIKKVFFQDQAPKSLSPSNSDKDEGIAEEILHENEADPLRCTYSITIDDPIIKRNMTDAMKKFEKEENMNINRIESRDSLLDHNCCENCCAAAAAAAASSNADATSSTTTRYGNNGASSTAIQPDTTTSTTANNNNATMRSAIRINHNNYSNNQARTGPSSGRLNSVLRKRNLSKQSISTGSPSGSCEECNSSIIHPNDTSTDEEDDNDEDELESNRGLRLLDDDEVRSKSEWTAVTTNSEDDDYVEEEANNSDDDEDFGEIQYNDHPFAWEFQKHSMKLPKSPSCTSSDKVNCTLWDGQDMKKAGMTVLDISAQIIAKVERAKENSDYLYLGIFLSCGIAFLPGCWRLNEGNFEIDSFDINKPKEYVDVLFSLMYGNEYRTQIMIVIATLERLCLSLCVFFLLAVAEKTYKQRFLYAKLFSRITSTRKSKKSGIPHFRLNKVRNIKTWLSIRSYLQRRGPQRSVDILVSASFIASLILICFLSVELLKDSSRLYYLYNLEVIAWSLSLGFYLMRFMTLSSRISQKYRNLSIIITEQLNLYLKMEQKPHKKDELMVANNVLKLASELLKELDNPFRISNFASNPYVYNVMRLIILSAFSGALSELFGFKLKLYKIKLK